MIFFVIIFDNGWALLQEYMLDLHQLLLDYGENSVSSNVVFFFALV